MTTRAATAAETADKILAATKQLFTENTIAEITLAAIAQRSNVTVQTILRRFGDKDTVFAEAISRLGDGSAQRGQRNRMVDDLLTNPLSTMKRTSAGAEDAGEESSTPAISQVPSRVEYHRRWCEKAAATLGLAGATGRCAQLIAICDVDVGNTAHPAGLPYQLSPREMTDLIRQVKAINDRLTRPGALPLPDQRTVVGAAPRPKSICGRCPGVVMRGSDYRCYRLRTRRRPR